MISQLRSPKEPLREAATAELQRLGAGAAPAMIRRLTDNKVNQNELLLPVLGAVVAPEFADLLAEEATSNKLVVRRFVTRTLATYADPGLEPILAKGLEDKDGEVQLHCAAGLLGLQDTRGLELIVARTEADWDSIEPFLVSSIASGRGERPADALLGLMRAGDVGRQIAGLRLLRHLLPKEQARLLREYLDSDEASLRKEVINTLRVVVEGKPPLARLSVFQAIEMAKSWKERL